MTDYPTRVDLTTGDRVPGLATFPWKSDAIAAIKKSGLPLVHLPAHNQLFRFWIVGIVVAADDATVRLLVLDEQGALQPATYVQPGRVVATSTDKTAKLTRRVGELVDLFDIHGARTTALIDDVDETYAILRLANGRTVARSITGIALIAPLHSTSTFETNSTEREWRVKPNGRALGWRPVTSGAIARCSCGWSVGASDRAEARGLAQIHRHDVAANFAAPLT